MGVSFQSVCFLWIGYNWFMRILPAVEEERRSTQNLGYNTGSALHEVMILWYSVADSNEVA
jgi:hypothetical protein